MFVRSIMGRKALAVAVCAWLALGAGGTTRGVAWLPDSSGFLYLSCPDVRERDSTRLMRYDVKAKTAKPIAEKLPGYPRGLALSADGKKVAVTDARIASVREGKEVCLTITLSL